MKRVEMTQKVSKRKPAAHKIYFGTDVEEAIQIYNSETSELKKNMIFSKTIYPALNKLAENVINKYKFKSHEPGITYEDLKLDLVTFLHEKLHMISPEKGKAYSYFTITSRHYCIKRSQDGYKALVAANDLNSVDIERNIMYEKSIGSYRDDLSDFIIVWADYCLDNLNLIFKSKNDRKIADAILTLFKNASDVDMFNKKELYVLIREHSKLETQYITRVSQQVLKPLFFKMFDEFRKTGKISKDSYLL